MDNSTQRPIYLNLFQIRLPIGGVASIVHRLTGVILTLSIPAGIYLLDASLTSSESFTWVQRLFDQIWAKTVLFIVILVLAQHAFSGLRHLALDLDWGVNKNVARVTAWSTFGATLLVSILVFFGIFF